LEGIFLSYAFRIQDAVVDCSTIVFQPDP